MKTARLLFIYCMLGTVFTQIGFAQWVHVDGPTGDVLYLTASGSNMFAETNSGFLFSTDNGTQWKKAEPYFADSLFNTYAADSANFLLGTLFSQLPSFTGIDTSLANANIDFSALVSLVAGVAILYPGTYIDSVLVSLDTGSTALKISEIASKLALYAAGLSDTNIFSGVSLDSIRFTLNNGMQWISIHDVMSSISLYAIEKTDTYVFAGTNKGVFRAAKNGANWIQVNNGLLNTNAHALATVNTVLFAGTEGGVFFSTDNGTTWQAANSGLTNTRVFALVAAGSSLFAGTQGGGVFLSTNYGSSWKPVNQGLTYLNVNALAVSNNVVFTGTTGGGLWKRALSNFVTSVRHEANESPVAFGLRQNYPNPFNPSTIIEFDVAAPGQVSVQLYDGLGRLVRNLIDEAKEAGHYQFLLNAVDLPSGVYYCRLIAGSFTQTRKLMLVR